MRRSMDWALDDNMVDDLFVCTTLTGRRQGHTPFVQAGAETSDTGAEAVKPDPGSSWEGHSGKVGAGVRDENSESCGVFRPLPVTSLIWPLLLTFCCCLQMIMLLFSNGLMSCCAASRNGCLDLRRRAFAHGGQVSAEWSRCPGSRDGMAKAAYEFAIATKGSKAHGHQSMLPGA